MMEYVFNTTETIRYRFPTHVNDLVMDRVDATTSEVFIVVLEPGEAPPLHVHHDTEQIFFVIEGKGLLQIGDGAERFAVAPGDVVRIPPSVFHRIFCDGDKPLRYLCIDCFVKGRPQAEPTWDAHVRAVCVAQGWDFDQVRQP
jgi:mannose-6-phosphate isomerase-like protein (cupin superfamily)